MLFRQIDCNSLRIKKNKHFWIKTYTNLNIYAILISEVPDSMAAAPELNQFMLEFDLGRLCGMTLYEILSLAIDLAILILTALSYLKNRKS